MPRHDDDDDRPRRRRPRDEDEDDRPRRRPPDEEEERPRTRRKTSRELDEDDYEDQPRRKRRRKTPELNVAGAVAIGIGVLALVLTITPCLSIWFGIVPAVIGLLVGLFGLYMSQQTDGRQKPMLPFVGMGVSALAILVALSLMFVFKGLERAGEKWVQQIEAERKEELAKASKDVQSATNPIRITAEALAQQYDQNPDGTDDRYEGKVLEVTGTVQKVDFDELEDEYRVELRTGSDTTVDCDFIKSPAIQARLRQLKPGDRVTIRGKYIGITILEGCLLVN